MKSFRVKMVFASLLGAGAYIGGAGLTVSSGWLITMASSHPPILTLTIAIVMVRFFGIFRSLARYLERVVSHEAVFLRLTSLRVALFEKLSARSITFARDLNSGRFVKAIVDDVERAQEYQLRIVLPGIAAALSVTTSLALGIWIAPESLYFTLPASILLLIFLPALIKRFCADSAKTLEICEGEYTQIISSLSYGLVEASMYGYLDNQVDQAKKQEVKINQIESNLFKRSWYAQVATTGIIGSSIVASSCIALLIADAQLFPAVKITMLIFLPLVMFESITVWFPNLHASGKLLLARENIKRIQDEPDEPVSKRTGYAQVPSVRVVDAQVSWDKEFMIPVSFEVKAGQSLVIRGRSGSGKSTLALGLLGLLPHRGSIEVHGSVAGSLQRGHIFNTTLRENLKIAATDLTDDELARVLRLVELDPISLDTLIGEFGRPLSGGEAKRLGVARALLSGAQVLILDEPTEHLDHELAARIEERILRECEDRVLIIITHSGWSHADRTVMLKRE